MGNGCEAARSVQRDTGILPTIDTGDDRVMADLPSAGDRIIQNEPADALTQQIVPVKPPIIADIAAQPGPR